MSSYFKKGKGWRYDFTLKGIRYTETWFKTKKLARQAEAKKREEINNPPPVLETVTDMAFLEMLNTRLDYVKAYNSERHYLEYLYMGRRWTKAWPDLNCGEISSNKIEKFVLQRSRVSNNVANKEIR